MQRLHVTAVDAASVAAGRAAASCGAAGDAASTLLVLHGLFGSSRNWLHFSRALVRHRPDWRIALLDLPGHGAHDHGALQYTRPVSVSSAAADVAAVVREDSAAFPSGWRGVAAVVGHSMGGRIALELLQAQGQELEHARQGLPPLRVGVLDTMPGLFSYAAHDSDSNGVLRVLQFLEEQPPAMPSRKAVQSAATARGFPASMVTWLGTNLRAATAAEAQAAGLPLPAVAWACHVPTARALYASHQATDHWGVLRAPPPGTELHAVAASRSSRWQEDDTQARLQEVRDTAGAATTHSLEGGHWLHVDNPRGTRDWIVDTLLR